MNNEKTKSSPDWELIERHYRAGVKTVRQLAIEYGVSHTAIQKRATKFGWERDLTQKIQQTTQSIVATKVVAKLVATETKLSDAATVKAYAEASAAVELLQRDDVTLAMKVSRSQLEEVAILCDPEFRERLVALGEANDKSTENRSDKANELYQYIISLAGRVKLSKEIAAAHGVYIPMQRKILKLDAEGDKSQSSVDALLAKINAASE
ncbi:MAG: hypothetical protein GW848_12060 [Rhodoferax sp.]|nr:hypothetical protein [Rhodoferax sp.]